MGPVVEALRSAGDFTDGAAFTPSAGSLRLLLPEMSDRLPPLPVPTGDPRADRHLLFQGLLEVFDHLGPTVCVLEDLHWGDERTGDFLHFLASQLPSQLALVATYRREGAFATSPVPELASRAGLNATTAHISLEPLTVGSVHRLVNELVGADISEEFAGQIHERTSGIPFAVEEVVRLVQDRRELLRRDAWWVAHTLDRLQVPPTIRDSVVGRASQLDEDARRMTDAAAVLGTPATEDQLVRVAGLDEGRGAAALARALRAAVLVGTDGPYYGLRHALACQALYEAIPTPERTRLHLHAAQVLEATDPRPAAQLVRHNREAGRTREWVRYAEMAADQAWSHRDAGAATHFLNEALLAPGLSTATATRLAPKLAKMACECATPIPDTLMALKRLADDDRLPGGARGWTRAVVGTLIAQDDARSGSWELERALREPGLGGSQRARVMLNLALAGGDDDHITKRFTWVARSASEAAVVQEPLLDLEVAVAGAALLAARGDPRAVGVIDYLPWDAPGLDGDPPVARAMMCAAHILVSALLDVGEYGRARRLLDWAAARAPAIGWGRWRYVHEYQVVLLDWAVGEWDGLGDRARYLLDTRGGTHEGSAGGLIGALLALAHGQVSGVAAGLRWAAGAVGRLPEQALALAGQGRMHLEHGRPPMPLAEILQVTDCMVVRLGLSTSVGDLLPVAVEALMASGRVAEAESLAKKAKSELDGRDAPLAKAGLIWSTAVIAAYKHHHTVAARGFARAEHEYACLPRPYDAARAAERRGMCLVAASDSGAADCLIGALLQFRGLGATGDVKRIRRILRAHRFPVPAAERPHVDRGMPLSQREADVVRRAATGLTATEISAELLLSRRTVEQYLQFAIRKLGVNRKRDLIGRTDLAEPSGATAEHLEIRQ
jgi:DNA-binding CsgD family transcriptional regulator